MKKVLSISLIALILLNTLGYYAVFMGMEFQNNQTVARNLDEGDYDNSRLVTLSIPVSVPYMPDQTDFERVDGTFSYEGEFYRIVKQKYSNNTLIIVCYKDSEGTKIHNALTDYVKHFSDKPQSQKDNSKLAVTFIKDYIVQSFSIVSTSNGWEINIINDVENVRLNSEYSTSINHPPEIA